VRFQGANIQINDTYVMAMDFEGREYRKEQGAWRYLEDYETMPTWRRGKEGDGKGEEEKTTTAEGGEEGGDKGVVIATTTRGGEPKGWYFCFLLFHFL
jgi:hypothetical protein